MSRSIILIRGLFRGQYHWGDFALHLKETFPSRKVIAVDIPGTGLLFKQVSPSSITGMVESIRKQLPKEQPCDLLAISMGGMIAIKWAEMYPKEVSRVICINTSSRSYSPFYYRLKPVNYIKIFRALFSDAKAKESIIFSMVSNNAFDDRIISDWVRLSIQYPTSSINFLRQLLAAVKFIAKRPPQDILFISSLKDKLVSYEATQALAIAWQMPLIYNSEDGHDIPLDNPQWLCEKVVNYLSNVEPSSSTGD